MANITRLDQSTINQIAAGEVIDRPASVVKELMENAIDAGATAVTVEIREGGISFIRITDNGCGIEGEDIPLAFLRHTTSKIKSVEDLLTVKSLGFRGEALSSIAAVAQVELITKTAGSLTGYRYVIEGGEEKKLEEVGTPEGTTIIVRNLFYHTPARKKFLKSAATEGSYIGDLVQRMALSHPEISLRLIVNNQTRLHTAGNHNLKDIIYGIYGKELTRELIPVDGTLFCGSLRGYIGKASVSKGNRTWENYFINGRYIKSNIIGKALEEAYQGIMMQHRYPFCVLHLSIDPAYIDVNVHPSKMEIRFQQGEQLYQELLEQIRGALRGKEMIPSFTVGAEEKKEKPQPLPVRAPEPFEQHRMEQERQTEHAEHLMAPGGQPDWLAAGSQTGPAAEQQDGILSAGTEGQSSPAAAADSPVVSGAGGKDGCDLTGRTESKTEPEPAVKEPASYVIDHTPVAEEVRQQELFEEKIVQKRLLDDYQIIGQLFKTYWLVQFQDNFLIIDQHAAHEKVLYEKLVREFREQKIMSQQMNPPAILTLSPGEEALVREYSSLLREAGFEMEPFGGSEYAVYAMPVDLYRTDSESLLREIIDGLGEMKGSRESMLIFEQIALRSCKGAIKGNQEISRREMEALLAQLMELENPYTCPHGRPVIIRMTRYELEKKFKRVIS